MSVCYFVCVGTKIEKVHVENKFDYFSFSLNRDSI